jgi:hypothetical protein
MPSTRTFTHGYTLFNGQRVVGVRVNDLEISESHQRRNGRYISGGPFLVHHRIADVALPYFRLVFDDSFPEFNVYEGFIAPDGVLSWTSPSDAPVPAKPDYLDLRATAWADGATGYRKARPGNPRASYFNYTVEARDEIKGIGESVLRSVNGGFIRSLRSAVGVLRAAELAGEEFLNYAFGWRPLLADLRKMYNLQKSLSKELDSLRRANGKVTRRRSEVSNVTTTTVSSGHENGFNGWWPLPGDASNYMAGIANTYEVKHTVTKHAWFAGAFRSYVPDLGSDRWTRRAVSSLFGGRVTPSAIWESLPWSWLIDWFTNAGDVISNLSSNAAENQTSLYAYIMTTTSDKEVHTHRLEWPQQHNIRFNRPFANPVMTTPQPQTLVASYTIELTTKSRFEATPYGFGISFDGLSGYQYGILSALGITRGSFRSTAS